MPSWINLILKRSKGIRGNQDLQMFELWKTNLSQTKTSKSSTSVIFPLSLMLIFPLSLTFSTKFRRLGFYQKLNVQFWKIVIILHRHMVSACNKNCSPSAYETFHSSILNFINVHDATSKSNFLASSRFITLINQSLTDKKHSYIHAKTILKQALKFKIYNKTTITSPIKIR